MVETTNEVFEEETPIDAAAAAAASAAAATFVTVRCHPDRPRSTHCDAAVATTQNRVPHKYCMANGSVSLHLCIAMV